MKKAFAIIAGVVLGVACNSKPEGYTINGTVTGDLNEGTRAYLKTTDSINQWSTIDTTTIEKGTFTFTGVQDAPKMYSIAMENGRGEIPLVVENEEIFVNFQKDSLVYAQITGTLQNERLMDFLGEARKLSKRVQSIQQDMHRASREKDTATVIALQEEYLDLQEEAKNFNLDFSRKNADAVISVVIITNLWDAQILSLEELEELYETLTPEMKASPAGVLLKKELDETMSTEIGAIAPEFSAPTPDGSLLSLSEAKGKLTLIDFWAAWCKPCRIENPNVVNLYHKYQPKGLSIIGVSLDSQASDWKKAIASDGLSWHHVSNLKRFKDPIAERYNVKAIPATFLVDDQGVIVAKNLRGRALEEKVAELLR